MSAAAFRAAVEAWDMDAVGELLAENVVFHSPVTHHPFVGREKVTQLLTFVSQIFEDFGYTDELEGPSGEHILVFRARVGDRQIEGIDMLRLDEAGRIADFTVMIRPLSGLIPFAEQMAQRVIPAGLTPDRD